MQAQSNSELVADYLDAVIRKDVTAVDRFFAPEVEYMVNGTPVGGGFARSERRIAAVG